MGGRRQLNAWMVLAGVVVVALLYWGSLLRPFERAVLRVVVPVQSTVYGWFRSTPEEGSSPQEWSREELVDRYRSLEERNQELIVENAQMRTLVQEADLLEEQLAFLQEQSYDGVSAKVSSRSSEGLSRTVFINRGTAHGVAEGDPVIIDAGTLVGVIVRADAQLSEVELLTSFSSRVSAAVQNEPASPGIVRGDHNLSLIMEFIPQFDLVEVGQTVTTSGVDSTIPGGLIVGEIQEVHAADGSLFQRVTMRPLFRPEELLVVSVLTR